MLWVALMGLLVSGINVVTVVKSLMSSIYTYHVIVIHQLNNGLKLVNNSSSYRSAEKLELNEGRWVFMQPMLSRRSTLGVAILEECLYAVGGFDGNSGLDSVEKYSPGNMISDHVIPVCIDVMYP